MDRRRFLSAAAIGAATLAAPARIAAQAAPDPRTRRILDLAREQIARADAQLWRRDIAAIVDFGVHSAIPRFHLANLEAGAVDSLLVSHGSGSDPEHDGWLNSFSNLPDSWATSRGAYVTWEWYEGKYGTSMRLGGLEPTNDLAYDRAIVMHAAQYASPDHVARWGRLGRSNGCFALNPKDLPVAMNRLSGGRLIYADTIGIGPRGEQVAMPWQAPVDHVAFAAMKRGHGTVRQVDAAAAE